MTEPKLHHLLKRHIFKGADTMLYVNDHVERGTAIVHDHDFLEIVLIEGGKGQHVSAHGVQTVSRGDLFVLRPGAWHRYRHCQDLHVYNCCCAPELLRRELALLGNDPAVTRLLWTAPLSSDMRGVSHHHLSASFTDRIEVQMQTLLNSPDEPFTVRVGRLLVMLGQLGNELYPQNSTVHGGVHTAVWQAVQLLEDGYSQEWDLTRLATLTRLNPSYLTRLFKASTGQSPMAYLSRYRVERAAQLLLATELPVNEIALQVGWQDPNYFARRFKAVFGITPTTYRTQQSGEKI